MEIFEKSVIAGLRYASPAMTEMLKRTKFYVFF